MNLSYCFTFHRFFNTFATNSLNNISNWIIQTIILHSIYESIQMFTYFAVNTTIFNMCTCYIVKYRTICVSKRTSFNITKLKFNILIRQVCSKFFLKKICELIFKVKIKFDKIAKIFASKSEFQWFRIRFAISSISHFNNICIQ